MNPFSGKWRMMSQEQIDLEVETAVRARTRELSEKTDALETANRLKSQFLADISGEIRTPMTGVLGAMELALATPLTREQREYLELSRMSGESLLSLLDDIQDFSETETKELSLRIEEFSLRNTIRGAINTITGRMDRKGPELRAEVDPDLPDLLRGDPDRLRQVLVKLFEHSSRTRSGSGVLVSVRTEQQFDSDSHRMQDRTITLLFVIQNIQGSSKTPHGVARFDALQEVKEDATRKYGGSGLGMVICGRLVRLMNGRLWAQHDQGHESSHYFTAEFTVSERSGQSEQPGAVPSRVGAVAGSLVLVAEDNRINQIVVQSLLAKEGVRAIVANNGREAVDLLERVGVDLALIDVQMPEMGGIEATRLIRERERVTGKHLPIIALTAHTMQGDREKCLAAGMDGYLSKPIDGGRLISALRELLGRQPSAKVAAQ